MFTYVKLQNEHRFLLKSESRCLCCNVKHSNCIHQSKFQSLLQTYVNVVYELMHDPEKNNFASRFKCKVLLLMLPKVAQRTMLCLSPALSQEDKAGEYIFLLYINHSINGVLHALCLWGINCTIFFLLKTIYSTFFFVVQTHAYLFFLFFFAVSRSDIWHQWMSSCWYLFFNLEDILITQMKDGTWHHLLARCNTVNKKMHIDEFNYY